MKQLGSLGSRCWQYGDELREALSGLHSDIGETAKDCARD